MGEPALITPNDHGTRKLLRRSGVARTPLEALFAQVCWDSLYVFHDDFDKPALDSRWVRGDLGDPEDLDEDSGFTFDPLYPGGAFRGHTGRCPLKLVGATQPWRAARRCTMAVRLNLNTIALSKFEVGFADIAAEQLEAESGIPMGGIHSVVNVKSTPSAYGSRRDFAIAVRDTVDDTNIGLAAAASPPPIGRGAGGGAITVVDSTGSSAIAAGTEFSLLITTNEQAESRLWINGIPAATNRSGPYRDAPLALWLFFDKRGGGGNLVRLVYARAWQERADVQ